MKTVRSRMIMAQGGVVLIIIVLISISIYSFTSELLTRKNQQSYSKVLDATEVIFNDSLTYYTDIARIILQDRDVQNILSDSEETANNFFMGPDQFRLLEDACKSYANGVKKVNSIYLFDESGSLFYIDQNHRSMAVQESVSYAEMESADWFAQALAAKGREVYFGYDVIWNNSDNFSCVKVINSLSGNHKIGMLILTIRADVLENVFTSVMQGREVYAVMYDDGEQQHLVYQKGYSEDSYDDSLEAMLENADDKYEVNIHECEKKGWQLVHLIDREDVFYEAGTIRMIIIGIGGIAMIVTVLITIFQAYQITKPLYLLKDSIQRVGMGERTFRNEFKNDEIGMIGQEFQLMVREKIELNERIAEEKLRRRESELELLQSQINPHFLYNTLDTLYWMAIAEDSTDIAQLTQALSEIFKISLNSGEEMITIGKEVQFIEDYLYIQNIRFEGRFSVQIQIEDQLYEWRIIKLILQPFVENAIYHGLEPKMGQGILSIIGKVDADFLVFTITDNGVGMDSDQEIAKGFAIQNVRERIRMSYGDHAEIIFTSKKDEGTTVQIYLPVMEVKRVGNSVD